MRTPRLSMIDSSISMTVMRRVRRIDAMRPFVSAQAISLVVFFAALWAVGREVWVAKVFANMPPFFDISDVSRFFASAFLHTEFIVQAAILLAGIALFLLMRDAIRSLSHSLRFA